MEAQRSERIHSILRRKLEIEYQKKNFDVAVRTNAFKKITAELKKADEKLQAVTISLAEEKSPAVVKIYARLKPALKQQQASLGIQADKAGQLCRTSIDELRTVSKLQEHIADRTANQSAIKKNISEDQALDELTDICSGKASLDQAFHFDTPTLPTPPPLSNGSSPRVSLSVPVDPQKHLTAAQKIVVDKVLPDSLTVTLQLPENEIATIRATTSNRADGSGISFHVGSSSKESFTKLKKDRRRVIHKINEAGVEIDNFDIVQIAV